MIIRACSVKIKNRFSHYISSIGLGYCRPCWGCSRYLNWERRVCFMVSEAPTYQLDPANMKIEETIRKEVNRIWELGLHRDWDWLDKDSYTGGLKKGWEVGKDYDGELEGWDAKELCTGRSWKADGELRLDKETGQEAQAMVALGTNWMKKCKKGTGICWAGRLGLEKVRLGLKDLLTETKICLSKRREWEAWWIMNMVGESETQDKDERLKAKAESGN